MNGLIGVSRNHHVSHSHMKEGDAISRVEVVIVSHEVGYKYEVDTVVKGHNLDTTRIAFTPEQLRGVAADFNDWADEADRFLSSLKQPDTPAQVLVELVDGCIAGITSTSPDIQFNVVERDGSTDGDELMSYVGSVEAQIVTPEDFALAAGLYAIDEALEAALAEEIPHVA